MPVKISHPAPQTPQPFYIAKPAAQEGKGVLVLHAWRGLNPFMRSFCDRLASEGFIALAPDLYNGKIAATIEEAKKLRSKVKGDIATQQILQALDHLCAFSGENPKIGVVGFSLGGGWALWLAAGGRGGLFAWRRVGVVVGGTGIQPGCRHSGILRLTRRRLYSRSLRVPVSPGRN